MAIYHLEAKVVSRGAGRSAVAASAYLSCTNIRERLRQKQQAQQKQNKKKSRDRWER